MTKRFEQFLAELPAAEQIAIAQVTEQLIAEEMTLRQLRKARKHPQKLVGEILHVNQAAVSKIERRTDIMSAPCVRLFKQWGANWKSLPASRITPPLRINQFEELAS